MAFSPPEFQNFYQTFPWDFFGLVIPSNSFLEIGRNYVSIIITIISNITVLVSTMLFALDILCLRAMASITRLL